MAGQRGVMEGNQLRKKAGSLSVQIYHSPSECLLGAIKVDGELFGLALWKRNPRSGCFEREGARRDGRKSEKLCFVSLFTFLQ